MWFDEVLAKLSKKMMELKGEGSGVAIFSSKYDDISRGFSGGATRLDLARSRGFSLFTGLDY